MMGLLCKNSRHQNFVIILLHFVFPYVLHLGLILIVFIPNESVISHIGHQVSIYVLKVKYKLINV